ncbi:MAG: BCD family MFS transporter [Chloroflexota bacterium]
MRIKRLQLALVHTAVAMTLVPINSTLNRVMIKELALSATLVALMASLPYLFAPIQVAVGAFSDRHPLLGRYRTPYILIGLLLCVAGVVVAPQVAFLIAENFWTGLLAGLLAFGAWGMGYNLAAVSYLSLASELSGEKGRGQTVAVMWFMMIAGIVLTAILLSTLVNPYTPAALARAFWLVGGIALGMGLLGLLGLEPRRERPQAEERYAWGLLLQAMWRNVQVRLFFAYLIVLLAALLGQDILLEPFAAEAFAMTVRQTTRITSLWGVFVLLALLLTGWLETRLNKRTVAAWGGSLALIGFALIVGSGFFLHQGVFYGGVMLLGIGTGVSTVSNLSLMLDMTVAGQVGLFMGAWGMANAISRLVGSLLGGVGRDLLVHWLGNATLGYSAVFAVFGGFVLASLVLLRWVNVQAFRQHERSPLAERAAAAMDS